MPITYDKDGNPVADYNTSTRLQNSATKDTYKKAIEAWGTKDPKSVQDKTTQPKKTPYEENIDDPNYVGEDAIRRIATRYGNAGAYYRLGKLGFPEEVINKALDSWGQPETSEPEETQAPEPQAPEQPQDSNTQSAVPSSTTPDFQGERDRRANDALFNQALKMRKEKEGQKEAPREYEKAESEVGSLEAKTLYRQSIRDLMSQGLGIEDAIKKADEFFGFTDRQITRNSDNWIGGALQRERNGERVEDIWKDMVQDGSLLTSPESFNKYLALQGYDPKGKDAQLVDKLMEESKSWQFKHSEEFKDLKNKYGDEIPDDAFLKGLKDWANLRAKGQDKTNLYSLADTVNKTANNAIETVFNLFRGIGNVWNKLDHDDVLRDFQDQSEFRRLQQTTNSYEKGMAANITLGGHTMNVGDIVGEITQMYLIAAATGGAGLPVALASKLPMATSALGRAATTGAKFAAEAAPATFLNEMGNGKDMGSAFSTAAVASGIAGGLGASGRLVLDGLANSISLLGKHVPVTDLPKSKELISHQLKGMQALKKIGADKELLDYASMTRNIITLMGKNFILRQSVVDDLVEGQKLLSNSLIHMTNNNFKASATSYKRYYEAMLKTANERNSDIMQNISKVNSKELSKVPPINVENILSGADKDLLVKKLQITDNTAFKMFDDYSRTLSANINAIEPKSLNGEIEGVLNSLAAVRKDLEGWQYRGLEDIVKNSIKNSVDPDMRKAVSAAFDTYNKNYSEVATIMQNISKPDSNLILDTLNKSIDNLIKEPKGKQFTTNAKAISESLGDFLNTTERVTDRTIDNIARYNRSVDLAINKFKLGKDKVDTLKNTPFFSFMRESKAYHAVNKIQNINKDMSDSTITNIFKDLGSTNEELARELIKMTTKSDHIKKGAINTIKQVNNASDLLQKVTSGGVPLSNIETGVIGKIISLTWGAVRWLPTLMFRKHMFDSDIYIKQLQKLREAAIESEKTKNKKIFDEAFSKIHKENANRVLNKAVSKTGLTRKNIGVATSIITQESRKD